MCISICQCFSVLRVILLRTKHCGTESPTPHPPSHPQSVRLTLHMFCRRDLHWGNVLVRATTAKKGSFLLDGEVHSLETKGVLVSIIDYSLSRLEIGQEHVFANIVTRILSLW